MQHEGGKWFTPREGHLRPPSQHKGETAQHFGFETGEGQPSWVMDHSSCNCTGIDRSLGVFVSEYRSI